MFLEIIQDEFKDANVETDVHRVLNLLFLIKAKGVNLQINYSSLVYQGKLVQIEDEYIRVISPGFKKTQERRAVLSVEILNRYYSFNVFINKSNLEGVFLSFPQEMKYLQRRLYKRIEFDDLFARFIILYSPIMQTNQEEKILETRYRYFLQEVTRDKPNIKVLYQLLMSEIKEITKDFSLKFVYKDDIPQLTLSEKIMLRNNKAFFIEDTSKIESYIEPIKSKKITNYSDEFEKLIKEKGKALAKKEFEILLKEDNKNFIVSYLMIPVNLLDRPIGYLKLETNQFEKHFITLMQALGIITVVEIFSYALTKIRIHGSHFNKASIKTRVVNISMSGLLFEIDDESVYKYLQKNRRIKLMIPILGEELEIYAEIVRYFPRDGSYYMGVNFFKNRPGNMERLEAFLFENSHFQFF